MARPLLLRTETMPDVRTPPPVDRRRSVRAAVTALAAYIVCTAIWTRPLLSRMTTGLPSDPWDPSFFASILKWNATKLPFSEAWWNAPHYYPTPGIAAFTESIVGLSPIASPIIWTTGDTLLAYNVVFFLSWVLSGWALYLLVVALTRRPMAAFLAGLAFAFNPYRTTEIAHIQLLSAQWLPLTFLALHKYVSEADDSRESGGGGWVLMRGRRRWLVLFAVAWLLTSLTNGHFMLYGAVIIGLWLAYFGSQREHWRSTVTIVVAWGVASIPLVPVMLKYQAIHTRFGLVRSDNEIQAWSAQPASWAHASSYSWFWPRFIAHGKDDLFPGATALMLIAIAVLVLLYRRRQRVERPLSARVARGVLIAAFSVAAVMLVAALTNGPILITRGDAVIFKMTDLNRALLILALAGGTLAWTTKSIRESIAHRSPLVFYACATVVCAVLACGPAIRVDDAVLLSPAPYRWLMALPGFRELRVLPRFWMIGTMCLAVAAGVAMARLRPATRRMRVAFFAVVAAGVFVDGWIPGMPMAQPPDVWPEAEPTNAGLPLLELPLGPDWDYPATYRAAIHTRRVVNGVSGYNPPYYIALGVGMNQKDSRTLDAMASFGALDVVVTKADDVDGAYRRWIESVPGATLVADTGRHVTYRLAQGSAEPVLGPAWPLHYVIAGRNNQDAPLMHDGRLDTGWDDYPQKPDAWILVDLGEVRDVGGVTTAIGDRYLDYPRHLVIELSEDGSQWKTTWSAPSMGALVLAYVRSPRVGDMRFAFPPERARYVRLRQTASAPTSWRISEVSVHAPEHR